MLFSSGVTEHTAPSCLQGTGHVRQGIPCPNLPFPLWRQECGFLLPLREGMDLLIYESRSLGWESSQGRLCKNTGICLPTLFAFDLLFWCRTAVWLRCYLLLPNHALGMYSISHAAVSCPSTIASGPTPYLHRRGWGLKKVENSSSHKSSHAPWVVLWCSKLPSLLLLMLFAE